MPRLRLGILLWLAGMLGVIVITFTVLPQLLRDLALPAPQPVILLASLAQSAIILALAVWAGVALAPALGLRAPAFEAAVAGRPLAPALGPQVLPGFAAGVAGGIALFAAFRFAPAAIAEIQHRLALPLLARLLYGGITEELLLRWGLATALVWLAWRLLQHRSGPPAPVYVWLAIGVSALVFGAGYLPAAVALVGRLSADIVVFVIVEHGVWRPVRLLCWRHGLEAAMIAHGAAHAVSYILGA